MSRAIIARHKHDSVIIEAGRKIMGTKVRSGCRFEFAGGSTGMKKLFFIGGGKGDAGTLACSE